MLGLQGAAALALLLALSAPGAAPEGAAPQSPADLPPPPEVGCGVGCVRCDPRGCSRCERLLVAGTRSCAAACPRGTSEAWARDDDLMGRVCYPLSYHSELLIGGCVGAALCLAVVACAALYARQRSRRPAGAPRAAASQAAHLSDFYKQLECLRPHAYSLLAILNNTRRQVRELYQFGNHEAALAYSCVLSDLAKLLLLLNRPPPPVVPAQWPRLFTWASKILKRYYTLGGTSNQQVTFLRSSPASQVSSSNQGTPSLTTFKPPIYGSSMDVNEDMFNKGYPQWDEAARPPSYSLIENESIPLSNDSIPLSNESIPLSNESIPLSNETIPLSNPWGNREFMRRESVWLEDEVFQARLRPQDEITTEL